MTQRGTVTLTGKSGTKYGFSVWDRIDRFGAIGVNYVMAKYDGAAYHVIYIGETGDASVRPFNHERRSCFDRHSANIVFVRSESSRTKRLEIETDLRHAYDAPCNRQ